MIKKIYRWDLDSKEIITEEIDMDELIKQTEYITSLPVTIFKELDNVATQKDSEYLHSIHFKGNEIAVTTPYRIFIHKIHYYVPINHILPHIFLQLLLEVTKKQKKKRGIMLWKYKDRDIYLLSISETENVELLPYSTDIAKKLNMASILDDKFREQVLEIDERIEKFLVELDIDSLLSALKALKRLGYKNVMFQFLEFPETKFGVPLLRLTTKELKDNIYLSY